MNDDEQPKRPPSEMKELHTELMAALKETVKAARDQQDLKLRAIVLERCAQAFSSIDQALTVRMTARIEAAKRS